MRRLPDHLQENLPRICTPSTLYSMGFNTFPCIAHPRPSWESVSRAPAAHLQGITKWPCRQLRSVDAKHKITANFEVPPFVT
jgi:hypothetical protein